MSPLTLPIPGTPHRVPLYAPLDAADYRARLADLERAGGTAVLALLGEHVYCWCPVVGGVALGGFGLWPDAAEAIRARLEGAAC
jgi:hypothetical protein